MPLHRLLYTSRSALDETRLTIGEQLDRIARQSAVRNAEVGITGVLLFVDDHFVQVLEGEPGQIEKTYELICCSFAHSDVKLVDLVPVKERLFGEWNMALLSAHRETSVNLLSEFQNVRFMVGINANAAIEQMKHYTTAKAAA